MRIIKFIFGEYGNTFISKFFYILMILLTILIYIFVISIHMSEIILLIKNEFISGVFFINIITMCFTVTIIPIVLRTFYKKIFL